MLLVEPFVDVIDLVFELDRNTRWPVRLSAIGKKLRCHRHLARRGVEVSQGREDSAFARLVLSRERSHTIAR